MVLLKRNWVKNGSNIVIFITSIFLIKFNLTNFTRTEIQIDSKHITEFITISNHWKFINFSEFYQFLLILLLYSSNFINSNKFYTF